MKTLTVQSEVSGDGKLRLEIACDLPPGPVEVVVVVQPAPAPSRPAPESTPERSARSGIFVDKSPGSLDLDALDRELNARWKAKLADLTP
jgi:hypothetical protein